MQETTATTTSIANVDRSELWREVVCSMIHDVEVAQMGQEAFAAQIHARRHSGIACASFWSRPHELRCGREYPGDTSEGGYLVSWQLAGNAHVTQGYMEFEQLPGTLAIIDGRRPMRVVFPHEVRRIIAKLPARTLEDRIPSLLGGHCMAFTPSGPFAKILKEYFDELSRGPTPLLSSEMELLVANIANLLKITAGQESIAACESKEFRRQAMLRFIRQNACDPHLSVESVASHLNVSRRLVQQTLREIETSFTSFITEERLQSAASKLEHAPDLPVSRVAYACGFNDVSHFNHLFKRRFGVPPSDYRRSRR
ncbi:HTH-type transcriptional activator RhaS [Paraburkholderia sediminicola]|uniref:HTH-type transcriptional activator RhaS n=1 Tax=Paraburkholderia sediminicola TaxID=458836 RepID=A0A6J5CQ10_9BURK|nr:AraC family transcriptional regulator [Paraburkholderia sediminicola]CAB3741046.1 HTH-type transcriptional activator RhaS [Paraburkholderia sediminicola]